MGSIEKRPRTRRDGTAHHVWRARTRLRNGDARSQTFARKVDAEAWLATIEAGKRDGTAADPKRGRTSYGTWLDRWWKTRQHAARPSTLARDESYLRNHVRPAWGDWQLAAIERADVAAWVGRLSDGGLAPATVRKIYQLFAASLDAAVTERYLGVSACRSITLPAIKREPMRFLTPDEIARLGGAIDRRYRALVLVAAYGGLRIGELAALTPKRVDVDRGQVHVVQTVSWVKGHLHLHEPKTASGRRKVGLPRFVVDEVAEHLDEHATGGLVFPSPRGGYLQPSQFRSRQFAPATAAARLDGLRVHDLRHTAVSLWIAAGANLKAVAGRAGHSSVAFTLDRYGHLMDDHDADLMDALDDVARAADPAGNVVALHSRGA